MSFQLINVSFLKCIGYSLLLPSQRERVLEWYSNALRLCTNYRFCEHHCGHVWSYTFRGVQEDAHTEILWIASSLGLSWF